MKANKCGYTLVLSEEEMLVLVGALATCTNIGLREYFRKNGIDFYNVSSRELGDVSYDLYEESKKLVGKKYKRGGSIK